MGTKVCIFLRIFFSEFSGRQSGISDVHSMQTSLVVGKVKLTWAPHPSLESGGRCLSRDIGPGKFVYLALLKVKAMLEELEVRMMACQVG